MRLGIVPYSNAKPLIAGLTCEIYEAPPAQLPLLAGPDDIILAPIVAAFEDPSLYMIEGVGIGSFGPVETVKLFFNKLMDVIPAKAGIQCLKNIRTISLDTESKTSVALLKVLFQFRLNVTPAKAGVQPYLTLLDSGWSLPRTPIRGRNDAADASLLIGDKVWEQGDKPALDLGEAWTEWTALPFVYACWMTKNPVIGREWKPKLIAQTQNNLENLNRLSTDPHLLRYWKQLCYELGPKQKEGIQLFQKYWGEMEKKPTHTLKWI